MAVALRGMSMGQNLHMYQNNCVYPTTTASANTIISNVVTSGKRQIAPAPSADHLRTNNVLTNSSNLNQQNNSNKKPRLNFQPQLNYSGHQPTSVARRNARERNRVKQVNNGFANLRQHIPQDIVDTLPKAGRGATKKLSKVDTLRMAVEYIKRLVDLLDDANETVSTSNRSYNSSYYAENSIHHSIPTCSEASGSPTPSYSSEASTCPSNTNIYAPTEHIYIHQQYENYPTKSEDEELLDVITNWQDENGFLQQS